MLAVLKLPECSVLHDPVRLVNSTTKLSSDIYEVEGEDLSEDLVDHREYWLSACSSLSGEVYTVTGLV